MKKRRVGLHVREYDHLVDVLEKVHTYGLTLAQFFLVKLQTHKLVRPSSKEIDKFIEYKKKHHIDCFVHTSFWVNLAGVHRNGYKAFKRELALTKELACTHMVMHPGSAKGAKSKKEGIKVLADMLNQICAEEKEVTIVLENTAHGNLTVGSDIEDFYHLKQLLQSPDRIKYCIDTAHAFSFGYNIATDEGRERFIELLETYIGIEHIILLHLNDSFNRLGSKIDRHVNIGTGAIGKEALHAFATDKRLVHIPIILELPKLTEEEEKQAIALVQSWI